MKITCLVLLFIASYHVNAQTTANANSSDSISHIEMYGETGKGDTAIIVYKNGSKQKISLPNEKAREKFLKKYKQNLPKHQVRYEKDKLDHENYSQSHGDIVVPNEIAEYTYNDDSIQIKLRSGKKEFYNLKDPAQKEKFTRRYNNFLKLE
jgi:hypothetical protein